jgi:hypothetical protein
MSLPALCSSGALRSTVRQHVLVDQAHRHAAWRLSCNTLHSDEPRKTHGMKLAALFRGVKKGIHMNKAAGKYLKEALDFAERLEILANKGDVRCDNDRCAVVFGVMRDSAYKIRSQAKQELMRLRAGRVVDRV